MFTSEMLKSLCDSAYFALSSMEPGDAIYLHRDGRVEIGRDGCKPSNSLCLTTYIGADDDGYLTRDDVKNIVRDWLLAD